MTARDRMIRVYDRALTSADYRQYFEDSGFYNFGFWQSRPKSQREACEALVDHLLDRIKNKGGRILDVACGPGATTKRLLRRFPAEMVTGINISEAQLAAARERVPGSSFLLMDAAQLAFADEQFDAVICVEAAFHFNTRERFLQEAMRVLKPGGTLVLTDMMFRGFMRPVGDFGQVPPANFVRTIDEYRDRWAACGLENISVDDGTRACLGGFRSHLAGWPVNEWRRGRMSLGRSLLLTPISASVAAYFWVVCRSYLIASAQKPATTPA